jgi:hypothetical protein
MPTNGVRDTPLGAALCDTGTSNQWSIISSIVPKVNKRMARSSIGAGEEAPTAAASEEDIVALLNAYPTAAWNSAGIWFVVEHGMICVNRAFGSARAEEQTAQGGASSTGKCSCRARRERVDFNSTAYNAAGGRHALSQSLHIGTCPCWTPAPTSHFHSWRRGYTGKGTTSNR